MLGEVEVEAEVGDRKRKSHDGQNSRGQHRKNIPNLHEIDLESLISCDQFTYIHYIAMHLPDCYMIDHICMLESITN